MPFRPSNLIYAALLALCALVAPARADRVPLDVSQPLECAFLSGNVFHPKPLKELPPGWATLSPTEYRLLVTGRVHELIISLRRSGKAALSRGILAWVEKTFATAPFQFVAAMGRGRYAARLVEFPNGLRAVYKEEGSGAFFEDEVLHYLISEWLGADLVAFTSKRSTAMPDRRFAPNGRVLHSLQLYIPYSVDLERLILAGVIPAAGPVDQVGVLASAPGLRSFFARLTVLDYVGGHADRHYENVLIDRDRNGYAVDGGKFLANGDPKIRFDGQDGVTRELLSADPGFFRRLLTLDPKGLSGLIEGFPISRSQAPAAVARFRALIEAIRRVGIP